jgi:hypothetical protein
VNRVLTLLSENGMVENNTGETIPAMDGRRGTPGFRETRGRPIRPVGQTALSNWTTSPVQSDRTDTPNLERQGCPEFGVEDKSWFLIPNAAHRTS